MKLTSLALATSLPLLLVRAAAAQTAPPAEPPPPPPTEPPVAPTEPPAEPPLGTPGVETPPPATAPETGEPGAKVGYHHGFFIETPDEDFALHIESRVQGRYTIASVDDGTDRNTESNFEIARARLTLAGNAFGKNNHYKFQTDFGKGEVTLKDYYVDMVPMHGVHLRVGQYKRPFSRQEITSSGRQEFVDRSIVQKAFFTGRDIGVMVHDNYEKSPDLEWAVGLFNGTGDKPVFSGDVVVDPATGEGQVIDGGFSNVPTLFDPTLVARIGINRGGIKGYSEADLEGGPLRWAVAASGLAQFDAPNDDTGALRGEVDGVVKVEGISASGGLYVESAQDDTSFFDQGFAAFGAFAQGGYTIDKKYEPALRYSVVVPDGADNNVHEILAGFSLYQVGHHFKWQTDAGLQLAQTAGDTAASFIGRTQLQLSF